MRRTARLIAALTLSACSGEPVCSFEEALADYTDDAALTDCGDLPSVYLDGTPIDLQPWIAGHDCAAAANAARSPFVLRFRQLMLEGVIESAFVGLSHRDAWELSLVRKGVNFDGPARATRRSTCASLQDTPECTDAKLVGEVCLVCAGHESLGLCPD